jgi:hypothetical protein
MGSIPATLIAHHPPLAATINIAHPAAVIPDVFIDIPLPCAPSVGRRLPNANATHTYSCSSNGHIRIQFTGLVRIRTKK